MLELCFLSTVWVAALYPVVCFTSIFSKFLSCLVLFTASFMEKTFYILKEVKLPIFCAIPLVVFYVKTPCQPEVTCPFSCCTSQCCRFTSYISACDARRVSFREGARSGSRLPISHVSQHHLLKTPPSLRPASVTVLPGSVSLIHWPVCLLLHPRHTVLITALRREP